MTRTQAQRAAVARLRLAGVPDPAREARLLLRAASGLDPAALLSRFDEEMPPHEAACFEAALATRLSGAPLSHALGERLFWGRRIEVTSDVLDPRPETEILIDWALEDPPRSAPPARIADIGVGSGCILLTLLAEWPRATGVGVDASEAALGVARRNAQTLGVADRAEFRQGDFLRDWTAGRAPPVDLLVSNPPYLDAAAMEALPPELRAEPALALNGGADGLDAYRALIVGLDAALAPGGAALFEIGAEQAEAVSALTQAAGWPRPELRRDLDGRARVLRLSRAP